MQRKIRHKRIRSKIIGTAARPRLCVFRSNAYIYVQLINDQSSKTIAEVSDLKMNPKKIQAVEKMSGKILKAYIVGQTIAEKALKLGIKKIVFDRGGYKYHGRVKAVAEGARSSGLEF